MRDSPNFMLEEMPEYLTAKHIADHLHVSKRHVYDLLELKPEKGGIENFRIGEKCRRVEKAKYAEWLEKRKSRQRQLTTNS